jgi:protocatechuate 3,4-dioxygenase beta subunit
MADFTRRRLFQLGFGSLAILSSGFGAFAACARRTAASPLAPTPHVEDDDAPPACGDATADNIEGPFYKKGAPRRAVLVGERDRGERLVVAGVVRGTSCKPIGGVVLDIWHADAAGGYDNDGYHFRGTLATDARGRWELRSIVPGRYLNGDRYRPAHVHVKLRARGYRELTTQLYFAGDPYNDGDPFIVPSLIMQHRKDGDVRRAAFDFVLAPA